MEEFPSGKEKDILHPHCKNCIKTSRCFMKPIPDESCEIINCAMKCGFKFHACKSEEHSLLCANEKVPCINAVYGCPFKLLRHQRAKHLETCPASVVVCTMEWNRWPLYNRERQTSTSPRKVNPPLESQLDVALALRDQRMLNEWLKTPRNIESIQCNQAVPVVSVATGAEYLCIETDNTIVLHDGSDEEYEELPEGGRYAFYFVAGDASCGLNSTTENSSFSYSAEYNGETNILEQDGKLDNTEIIDVCNALFKEAQKDGDICEDREINGKMCTDAEVNEDVSEKPQTGKRVCEVTRTVGMMCEEEINKVENHVETVEVDNSNYKLILHYESVPMVTEPWSTGNEYNMIPCDMELDEPSTNNSIQFLDNHHVSDIFSASLDDHISPADAPVDVECSPSSVPLDLDLTVEYLNRCRTKPRNIYTFVCAQEFRRDQYSMHYKNVHSDIHGGLNGWLEYRCPLAPHGCTYSMTRLYPSFKGARVVHSVVLESFGVKMCAQDDNSNMKLSYVSETLKNGILDCLEECEMDIDANRLSKEKRGLCQLPCEVLRHIFGFLDPFSLCNVALICHSFRAICATLLGERGIVVQRWQKEKNNWNIAHKTWMFSTSFTPVLTWGFEENGHMANHMKECPYFERNICTKPFFHLLNEEPSPELRAKLETKVEGDIW